MLEAREQPAVVAHLTRLRRQQLRLREQAAHERPHELGFGGAGTTCAQPLPAKARLGQMAVAQHRAHDRIVAELGTHARERFVGGAQIAARLLREHRELLARRGDVVGPHARGIDRRDRRHAGQPQMNEADAARGRRASAWRA